MTNPDTQSNEEPRWWCVECKLFANPSTHEHVIQLGEF